MKTYYIKGLICVLSLVCSSGIGAQNTNTNTNTGSIVVGEPHPEYGGIVFYLNSDGGGLIVDTEDLINADFDNLSMFRWAEPEHLLTDVNMDDTQFDDWESTSNRTDESVIQAYGDVGSYAAKSIRDQKGQEWRLPTAEESYFLYFNLKQNGFGDLADGFYWTSTEVPYDKADITPPNVVAINMQNGDQSSDMAKVQALKVRAVRSF